MSADVVAVLLENHRAFLRFLERRVGDSDIAEDVLQDAFAKLLAKPDVAPEGEAVVPWFYRLLRNAVITMKNTRQNLFFAFIYNALGVPVAAGLLYPWSGMLLSPMIASAAMTFSSVSVIVNALRLRRTAM